MRTTFLLIIVFLLACIVSAEIYIKQVKGIGFLEAPAISQTLWIIEWLLMVLTACVIGICIGWYMQEKVITIKRGHVKNLLTERDALLSRENHFHFELEQLHKKLVRSQHEAAENFNKWTREKDRMKEELNSWQNHAEEAKRKNTRLKEKLETIENEIRVYKKAQLQLEDDLEKSQAEREGLEAKLTKSFTLPSRDDLKLINGIGPGIEKKLNALGIYSFRQISEFTPRTIEEVSSAIKFFPKRIEKDNWVSQARNFEQEKRRQA
jgi:predicted flap endonuclease-1-like 5' DNA nuclease